MSDPRRVRRSSLIWVAGIAVLGIGLGVLAFVPLLQGGGTGTEGSLVGRPAPAISAIDLNGRRRTLSDGRGRLVWVNFWATSCEPCRTEMPAMERLAEAYGDRLLILGVDWGEERGPVQDFVRRYAIGYPILLDPTLDNYYRWATREGLPRHYFVDASGDVVREVIGSLDPASMATILTELLGPPSGQRG
ncbi:MAG: TlpA family protein disulfide reductase [Chloroflexota bacterium]|nr:TlpA family protein disulfide reductase [Chloroflexota bacterium]